MAEENRADEFLAVVRATPTLAAQSEEGYVFVFHDGAGWKVTADVDVWTSVGEVSLMVHPDGRSVSSSSSMSQLYFIPKPIANDLCWVLWILQLKGLFPHIMFALMSMTV